MKVLVDTSVWSQALRHKEQTEIVEKLTELIVASLVVIIGPIRYERLSGICDKDAYENLKSNLQTFDDYPITTKDYETVTEYYNICHKNGIQRSHIALHICAVAYNNNFLICTTDHDFLYYAKYLQICLLNTDTVE